MKHLLTLLLIANFSIANAQNQSLTLASDVWPPFTDIAGNKAIATSLVRQALNRSGITSVNKIAEFGHVLKGIDAKLYDGSAALWYSDQRAKTLLFSAPYLQNRLILVSKKGNDVSTTNLLELHNKTIGVVDAYDYGIISDSSLQFAHGNSDKENLQLLLDDKVDYILVDALLVQYLITYQGSDVANYLAIGSTPIIKRSLHFAIRKDVPNAEHIMERFNKAITKMVVDGTYNEILALNWIRTDIDGDGQAELVLNGDHAGLAPPTSTYSLMDPKSAPSKGALNSNNRFYIEGHTYNSWEAIPNQYKTAPNMPSSNDVIQFNFRLQN